jgi:tetraacyldisaccharide 4'-kinase
MTGGVVNRMLMPLAEGFKMGVALRAAAYRRGWLETRRLNKPVVSVGNLSVGGTGKTPFVAFLAELLMKRGWKPSILTRGYGRRKGVKLVPIAPDAAREPDPREVGDEPALLARKLPEVPIVVGADRYRAGLLAEEKFGVDLHILDDGFQHLALARDADIVLLDATQELSHYTLLPAGRLREPMSALRRAHIVVITRTELAAPEPLEEQVHKINPQSKTFRCATKLLALKDVSTGELLSPSALQDRGVYAFCGIGNPAAFFADLEEWGLSVTSTGAFPDHWTYNQATWREVRRLLGLSGLIPGALITTEKDALKLSQPDELKLPVLACVIQLEMAEAHAFEEALFAHLETARVSA